MIDYIIKVLYGQIIYKITYLMEQYEFLVITQNCKKEEKNDTDLKGRGTLYNFNEVNA